MSQDNNLSEQRRRLPRALRLRKTVEFRSVIRGRLSAADGRLIVYARTNTLDYPRLGVSVGRKIGNAVRRNRCKRTLREAFRLGRHLLPAGADYVLIPRPAERYETKAFLRSLETLARRLQRRMDRGARP